MAATTTTKSTATGTWVIDPEHTTLEFRVKHVGLAKVRGVFHDFDGVIEIGEDGTLQASGSVRTASLDTRIKARDTHLRSEDFFDVERHPEMTWATTSVERIGEDRLRVAGDLTIRGVTRSVVLDAEILGTGLDDEGAERIGIEAGGSIDRRDFGLTWNSAVDGRRLLVGNRVDLQLDVSAVRRG